MPEFLRLFRREQIKSKAVLLWRWAFWACACAVLMLSLLPPSAPLPTTGWDKSNHVLAFAALAFLAENAWLRRTRVVLPSLLVYGLFIEVLQSFTSHRHAEWGDLWADGLGLLMGEVLALLLSWWLARPQ